MNFLNLNYITLQQKYSKPNNAQFPKNKDLIGKKLINFLYLQGYFFQQIYICYDSPKNRSMRKGKQFQHEDSSDSEQQGKSFIQKTITALCGNVPFSSSFKDNRGPQIVEKIVIRRPLSAANHQTEIKANSRPLSGERKSPVDNSLAQIYQLMANDQAPKKNPSPYIAPEPYRAPSPYKAPQPHRAPSPYNAPEPYRAPELYKTPELQKSPSQQVYVTREVRSVSLPNHKHHVINNPEQLRNTMPVSLNNLGKDPTFVKSARVKPQPQYQQLKTVNSAQFHYVRVPSADGCPTWQLDQNSRNNYSVIHYHKPAMTVSVHGHPSKIGSQKPVMIISRPDSIQQTPKRLRDTKLSEASTALRDRLKNHSSSSTNDNVSQLVSQYNKTASKVQKLLGQMDEINSKIEEVKRSNSDTDSKVGMQES